MSDYKKTLNLPQTEFPMKANLANKEPERLAHWQSINLYEKIRRKSQGREKYILHDGPPYANGHLHLGHALNKILKDMIVKAKTLQGFDAPFVPGWDCHGLPIELNVEKKFGKTGVKISPDQFRKECRAFASTQVEIQKQEFKRLGVIGDWENPYQTMDFHYEANIIRALSKVIQRGHLHRGYKPVHWCLDCRSALAEAEVEYQEKQSSAIDVRFSCLDDAALIAALTHSPTGAGQGPINIPIWTTTPWTLPANQAVALNPNLEYALVETQANGHTERLLLAQSLVTDVMARYGIEKYRITAYGPGKVLENVRLAHPFFEREVPIVLGEHVTVEDGTGCVHTAPGHGQEDYVIGLHYHLPIDNPINDNGCFREDLPLLGGQHLLKANDRIIEILSAHGKLLHQQRITHSYPHCWRHKTPIIFLATPQWFISMDQKGLRRDALEAIMQVRFIPEWGQARLASMIESRPDWCISRQRAWGTPITLFIHKETKECHPNTVELLETIAEKIEEQGIQAWFNCDPESLLGEDAELYEKVTDTLDVWFDSGVSHFCVLAEREELQVPADLYLEGSDQHRGWFQSSLLSMIAINGTAPFMEILTHGFTVDAFGRKMSKSIGNVIAPDEIIQKYGADVLRLWVAATDYQSELTISDEILKRMVDAYRRIRNTARFLLANLFDFTPEENQIPFAECLSLDRWIIDFAKTLQDEIIDAYENKQFHKIYQKIHNFCANELGSFYLDIIKDRQYTLETNSKARRSCQTAMFHILEALVRWCAPILTFTAEEIWQYCPGEREESVFLTQWYTELDHLSPRDPMGETYWQEMMHIRDEVNKQLEAARANDLIGSALEADVTLYCPEKLFKKLSLLEDELRFVLITSNARIELAQSTAAQGIKSEIEGLYIKITPIDAQKCARCWHRRSDVGTSESHPELCSRCVDNISEQGELRQFA